MYTPPFSIHAMLPCVCGHCSTFWFYGDDETRKNPMWPKSCVPGKTIVYRCWHCGKEIEKKVEEVRCDIPTDFGAVSYTLNSHGLLDWLCPAHGRQEIRIENMTDDQEAYLSTAQNGFGLCCAIALLRQNRKAAGQETEAMAKCVVCNKSIPAREMVFFPHISEDDCEVGKLPICRSCWYDHEDLYSMEDECANCDQCQDEPVVSPGDYDEPSCESFQRMALQNVEMDDDGNCVRFELVCRKSGTVLSRVESFVDEDDEEDF